MKKLLYILPLILLLISCDKPEPLTTEVDNTDTTTVDSNTCIAQTDSNCICIEIYEPVCGCDSITYSNSCFAACAGVEYTTGACPN